MAYEMPVTDREKPAELFDRHPFGQWLKKRYMEQGLEQGKLAETRTAILDYVESRFSQQPAGIEAALGTIQDLKRLQTLRREVFKTDSLQEALRAIAQATDGAVGTDTGSSFFAP